MLAKLAEVNLRGGATMEVKLLEPPEEEYARRLLAFLRHKDDDSMRGIRERVLGKYAKHCLDRYFVGEVDGRIVGQVWYGLPRIDDGRTFGIGNFGHVYTEPDWRGQGIAGEITRIVVDHFNADATGSCLLCTAGEQAGRIYLKHGFQFIPPTARSGAMGLVKPSVAPSFAALDERYFAPGLPVTVRPGHIGDRHDIDRMLDFSAPWIEARSRWHLVGQSSHVPTFISALHYVEDGRGLICVLQTSSGSIVGYAFVLNLGSRYETGLLTFDMVLHPHYLDHGVTLARGTLEPAEEAGLDTVHALVAACDQEKLQIVQLVGFAEQYRFARSFGLPGEDPCDVLLLRAEG